MNQSVPVLLLSATLALAAPLGAATWYVDGGHEPDNALDDPTLMFTQPPAPGQRNLYFSGFATMSGRNPNVGALETRVEVPTNEGVEAFLGVWADCNGDGYIGMAETAVREYKAEALLDTSVCPPVTGSPHKWPMFAFNYNGWVTEFIPVAGKGSTLRDLRVIFDDEAMVWGDYGLPSSSAEVGGSCASLSYPRGELQSTGGVLNHYDCFTNAMEAWNTAMDSGGDPLGLRFANDDDARGSWMDRPTFGSDDSRHSMAYINDCSGGKDSYEMRVGDELNETNVGDRNLGKVTADQSGGGPTHDITVYPVAPRTGDTQTGTLPGTYNATVEGARQNCDTSDDRGADFYSTLGEGDFSGTAANDKRQANWNFGFSTTNRGGAPFSVISPGATGMPSDLTNVIPPAGIGSGGSGWGGGSALLKYGPSTTRGSVGGTVDGSDPIDLAGAYHITYYAHVGAATLAAGALTPGGSGTYASDHCTGVSSGIRNGWNCDKTQWYRNPDGSAKPETIPLARPGQAYELRDIDCYDGGVKDTVGVLPAYYGTSPCG